MKCLLLGTSGCHLCEQAETIIDGVVVTETSLDIERIDIAEHTDWQVDYAVRIPVLLHEDTMQALDWPFTETDVFHFISNLKS
ncbi:MAG: glutaredoxin family protein [Methyloglobulus sp.]|nr:glutaredoxin family protein [Methyloglobulus sp.]